MNNEKNQFCECGELFIIEYDEYVEKFFVDCFSCGFVMARTSERVLIKCLEDREVYR